MKKLIVILIMLVLLSCAVSCTVPENNNMQSDEALNTPTAAVPTEEGGELSELVSTTLEGEQFKGGEFFAKNKLTVINIWATWCQPCVEELPNLDKINHEFNDKGVAVIGILFDSEDDGAVFEGKSILTKKGATYTQLCFSDSIRELIEVPYNVQALPTTLFVDSSGNVIRTEVGAKSYSGWSSIINSLLG